MGTVSMKAGDLVFADRSATLVGSGSSRVTRCVGIAQLNSLLEDGANGLDPADDSVVRRIVQARQEHVTDAKAMFRSDQHDKKIAKATLGEDHERWAYVAITIALAHEIADDPNEVDDGDGIAAGRVHGIDLRGELL